MIAFYCGEFWLSPNDDALTWITTRHNVWAGVWAWLGEHDIPAEFVSLVVYDDDEDNVDQVYLAIADDADAAMLMMAMPFLRTAVVPEVVVVSAIVPNLRRAG